MKNIYKPLPTIKIKSEPEKAMEKIIKEEIEKKKLLGEIKKVIFVEIGTY